MIYFLLTNRPIFEVSDMFNANSLQEYSTVVNLNFIHIVGSLIMFVIVIGESLQCKCWYFTCLFVIEVATDLDAVEPPFFI